MVRGPLSPADAATLEGELLAALGASVVTVDPLGLPLGHAARELELRRVDALLRQGVDLVLRGKHEEGRARIDQVVTLFEATLGAHENHALLHDALLAQAESLFSRGQSEAARTTLTRLSALAPDLAPTEPPGLVSLWREGKAFKKKPGRLEVKVEGATAEIRLDGRALGPAPVEVPKLDAGAHVLAAEWHDTTVSQTVQVSPGQALRVTLAKPPLGEKARAELLTQAALRGGPAPLEAPIAKLATLSSAERVAVAVVREDALILAIHGADGRLEAIAGAPRPENVGSQESKQAARALAEAALAADGPVRLGPTGEPLRWAAASYEAFGGTPPPPETPAPREHAELVFAPTPEAEEPTIFEEPWFWVVAGAVVAGAAVAVAIAAQPAPTTTVVDVIFPSRSN